MLDYNLDVSENSYQRVYTIGRTENPFSFCLSENGYFEAGSGYYTHRNNKPAALYLYTLSGEGRISWKGQTAALTAGTALLIECGEEHDYRTVSKEPWCFYWAHFTGNGLNGILPLLADRLTPLRVDQPVRIRELFEQLDALHERTDRFAFSYRSSLLDELLSHSVRALEREERGCPRGGNAIEPAKSYIHAHLSEPITVEGLADKCNLSKFHFIRLFRACTGFSPYRYLQINRIDRAKELLISTDLPVSEIAAAVGFSSSSNFGKVFREITGMTPAHYRSEQFRWKE